MKPNWALIEKWCRNVLQPLFAQNISEIGICCDNHCLQAFLYPIGVTASFYVTVYSYQHYCRNVAGKWVILSSILQSTDVFFLFYDIIWHWCHLLKLEIYFVRKMYSKLTV